MKRVTIRRNGQPLSLPLKLNITTTSHTHHTGAKIVDSHSLERFMDDQLGWMLSEVSLNGGSVDQILASEYYIQNFSTYFPGHDFILEKIREGYKEIRNPICMLYRTEAELMYTVGKIYQLMYFHYFLGRNKAMKNSFPKYCCGISSYNLTLALWQSGTVAAVSTYNRSEDHAYVIVPYYIKETDRRGVILADPTSDQLYVDQARQVRNYIAILPPGDWEYVTDWKNKADLYPELVQVCACYGNKSLAYEGYLSEAFNNGAVVR